MYYRFFGMGNLLFTCLGNEFIRLLFVCCLIYWDSHELEVTVC